MAPGQVPKRGRGGTPASRQRMLHALVHTESWAVDLAWDIVARFGNSAPLPRAFFDDFVAVAADEAHHYSLLQACFVPVYKAVRVSGAATWSAHSIREMHL